MACGPFFPIDYLQQPKAPAVSPKPDFVAELRRIRERVEDMPGGLKDRATRTEEAAPIDLLERDLSELELAMLEAGIEGEKLRNTLDYYSEIREEMLLRSAKSHYRLEKEENKNRHELAEGPLRWEELERKKLRHLPKEFRLYLKAAASFHADDIATARKVWNQLLGLPVNERSFRSTWASWMLGKTAPNLEKAQKHFVEVCRMRHDGFADSLDLVTASLRWIAKFELESGNRERAIELYYAYWKRGGDSGVRSLREAIADLKEADPAHARAELRELAGSSVARRIVSVGLLQGGLSEASRYSYQPRNRSLTALWCDVLQESEWFESHEADRLAWLAYSQGNYELAEDWLSLALDTEMAQWIRAKLHILNGDLESARDLLGELPEVAMNQVVEAEIDSHQNHKMADLGAVYLGLGDFEAALDSVSATRRKASASGPRTKASAASSCWRARSTRATTEDRFARFRRG